MEQRPIHTRPSRTLRRCFATALLALAPALGCSVGDSGEERDTQRSLCPQCPAQVGGESSDFDGTPTPCGAISERVAIDAEQVSALGYDLDAIEARIVGPIDAPFTWTAQDTHGEPAQGYQAQTRVRGELRLLPGYTHYRPDPRFCDGGVCDSEERGVRDLPLASCLDFLELEVELELSTSDGAIAAAVARGTAVQWRSGAEGMVGEGPRDEIHVHAYANLLDVTGSLELFPGEGEPVRAQYGDTNYSGVLATGMSFEGEDARGWAWPEIWLQLVNDGGGTQGRRYRPLDGRW